MKNQNLKGLQVTGPWYVTRLTRVNPTLNDDWLLAVVVDKLITKSSFSNLSLKSIKKKKIG